MAELFYVSEESYDGEDLSFMIKADHPFGAAELWLRYVEKHHDHEQEDGVLDVFHVDDFCSRNGVLGWHEATPSGVIKYMPVEIKDGNAVVPT